MVFVILASKLAVGQFAKLPYDSIRQFAKLPYGSIGQFLGKNLFPNGFVGVAMGLGSGAF